MSSSLRTQPQGYALPHPNPVHPQAPSAEDLTLFTSLAAYADALDALPLDLTRSFSDLRELDAVLGAHISSLTARLRHLTALIEDPNVTPGERLVALKEVAEEARAYKMGGEDKIRVAVNTADIIVSHTDYIDSLLDNLNSVSTLTPYLDPVKYLRQAGIIPGTSSGEIHYPGPTASTSSAARPAHGSSSGGFGASTSSASYVNTNVAGGGVIPGYINGAAPDYMGGLPVSATKKSAKKSIAAQNIAASSGYATPTQAGSVSGGGKSGRDPIAQNGGSAAAKKRKSGGGSRNSSGNKAARTDRDGTAGSASRASGGAKSSKSNAHAASAGGAAIQNGATAQPSRSARAQSALFEQEMDLDEDQQQADPVTVSRSGRVSRRPGQSGKADAGGDDEESESGEGGAAGSARRAVKGEADAAGNGARAQSGAASAASRSSANAAARRASGVRAGQREETDAITTEEAEEAARAANEPLYCYCQRVSFGEMIGCDDDYCKYEWFHIGCLGMDKAPSGTWYCDECAERRRKKGKKSGGSSRRR